MSAAPDFHTAAVMQAESLTRHYGVSQGLEKGVGAHVWVSVGDRIVIGGEEAGRFACLATYPDDG